MPQRPSWLVPVVGAALSAVLSSGMTAAFLRAREPETVARPGEWLTTTEDQHLAALLVAPGEPFTPVSDGSPVTAEALGPEALSGLGFQRGWSRAWRSAGERLDAFVLEFAEPAGAESYARGIGRAARLLIKPEPFTVPGVPDGSGLADTVKDRNGRYAQVVVLHRGERAVLLVLATTTSTPGPDLVALAQRQYAALAP